MNDKIKHMESIKIPKIPDIDYMYENKVNIIIRMKKQNQFYYKNYLKYLKINRKNGTTDINNYRVYFIHCV